ncbi:MAG: putative ABC transporter permease [Clostridia bacterium]|nr:putative ABC transporter permease [Clostridia bacterium]
MQKENSLLRRLFWGYANLFWVFFFGSILGFVIEGLWHIVLAGTWVDHSATVVGPFCIVYGVGAVAIFVVAKFLPRRAVVLQFLVFALTGGAVEYFTSLFQERTFGSVSWDYSSHTLNLGGRVSGQMAILWGFLGMVFVGLIYPTLARLLRRMHTRRWHIFCVACSVFMAFNLAISASAIFRWKERAAALPPSNKWEAYLDKTYPDTHMEYVYSDMHFR